MGGKKFESTAGRVVTERRTPSRQASVSSDVGVPFLQSIITGIVVAALIWMLAGDGRAIAVGFGVFSCVTWIALLVQSRSLLWRVEKVTGFDLDRDTHIGEPPPRRPTVVIDPERARRSTEAERKEWTRQNVLALVQRKHQRERAGLASGQKEMRDFGFDDDFHAEVGDKLIQAGLARRTGSGGWELVQEPGFIANAIKEW